ncbi:hypothetical protein [Phytohabitans houttuyneae]|nr:hypothetical protein [Phytohabitans houttuyneae]
MLWQAIAKPQRQALCGFAGAPTVGRLVFVTASQRHSQGPRRRG